MTPDSAPLYAPLSFGQEQWWLLDQIEPGNTGNNVAVPLRLRGKLDIDAIERIGNLWRQRHETLRTHILRHNGELQQVVMPYEPESLKIIDLSDLPLEEREAAAQRLTNEDAQYIFDLRTDNPLRLSLLRLAKDEHIWLRTIHHIACDGWSVNVLLRETAAYYNALCTQESADARDVIGQTLLPVPPLSYRDYTQRQRADTSIEAGLAFWKEKLGNIDKSLPPLLQSDQSPASLSVDSSLKHLRHSVDLDIAPEVVAAFKALCQQQNATFFTTLLAAFSALLHRIGEQDHFVIGTGVADRSRRDTRDLVGFLVSTLALPHDLSGDPTFTELLTREIGWLQETFAHAHVPFRRVVEEIAPARNSKNNLLFQTLVIAVPPNYDYPLNGLVKLPWNVDTGGTIRGLLLQVKQFGDNLSLRFDYDSDFFDRTYIERLVMRFAHLLEVLPKQAGLPLSQLDILPASERATLAQWGNGECVEYSEIRSLQGLVTQQAQHTPDAIALQSADGKIALTYTELEERAESIANRLRALNITRGHRVGVYMGRAPLMALATLGALRAGATVVPLDTTHPAARLQAIAADAKPSAVLTTQELSKQLGEDTFGLSPTCILCLDDASVLQSSLPVDQDRALEASDSEDLAYLLYTSGSTGSPKGVAMPHRALVNLMQWQRSQSTIHSGKAPRTLQFAPLSFDVAWQEFFSTWICGATLVIADDAARREPETLLQLLIEQRIERLFLPFVALQQLAWAAIRHRQFPNTLREIISAGEQLLVTPQIRSFFKEMPDCVLHNHYGPTETHVVTFSTLQGDIDSWPERPGIGRPIANAQITIIDKNGEQAPLGIAGEIHIAGKPVAQGYWNQPELTQKKFSGNRRYATGDLGRWRNNGELEFLGRNDAQLKVRGYRVEPGDIENTLLRHPAISEVAVTATTEAKADSGHTRLSAYLVVMDNMPVPDARELRDFLSETLPEYMIPATFTALDAFPLTSSGKIDRRALKHALPVSAKKPSFVSVDSSTLGLFEDGKL